jgi:hypothetical protein
LLLLLLLYVCQRRDNGALQLVQNVLTFDISLWYTNYSCTSVCKCAYVRVCACEPRGKPKFQMLRRALRTSSKSNGYNKPISLYCSDGEIRCVSATAHFLLSCVQLYLNIRLCCRSYNAPQPRVRLHAYIVFADQTIGVKPFIFFVAIDKHQKNENARVTFRRTVRIILQINVTTRACVWSRSQTLYHRTRPIAFNYKTSDEWNFKT